MMIVANGFFFVKNEIVDSNRKCQPKLRRLVYAPKILWH